MNYNNTTATSLSSPVSIAISSVKFDRKPEGLNWAKLNDSFDNISTDPMSLMNYIYQGHPFAPCMDGRRSIENFKEAQHIGVDMDTGDKRSSLDTLLRHPFVREHGAIAYETPSHTPDKPRSRVLFLLDKPIKTSQGYRLAIDAVTSLFSGADAACVDPARFFYGNGRLQAEGRTEGIRFTEEARLPLESLRQLVRQARQNRKRSTAPPAPHYSNPGDERPDTSPHEFQPGAVLANILGKSRPGERNRLGFWFACRLKENNVSMSEATDWMRQYQQAVQSLGNDAYTEKEALTSLTSAYR